MTLKPWWVRIRTTEPQCIYYFGPFEYKIEAFMAQFGYIKDLKQENAQGIQVKINQFSPKELTICLDEDPFITSKIKLTEEMSHKPCSSKKSL
jgi:hypothetical protein